MRLVNACLILFCIPFVFTPSPVTAQQLNFERTQSSSPSSTSFAYRWEDAAGSAHALQFDVEPTAFLSPFDRYRNYNLKRANRELYQRVTRYIKQQGFRGVDIALSPRQQQLTISLRRAVKQAQRQTFRQQLERVQQYYYQQWQDYLNTHHYRYLQLPSGDQGIIPNAISIARAQEQLFNPLIDAIGQTLKDNSRRSYAAFIAQFIQAIPYDELADNLDSRGDGFMPPNQVIYYNRGDCDSKASLMAALIRPIIPNAKMAIIYLPGHALFAVAMSAQPGDTTIEHQGTKLVLTEIAGPEMMPIGKLAAQSQFYIDSGQYVIASLN